MPITHKGDQEAVQIASGAQNATLTPQLPTDNARITVYVTKRKRSFSHLHSDVNCTENLYYEYDTEGSGRELF